MMIGMMLADEPLPHLSYGPNDTVRLELGDVKNLPKEIRLCAVGVKYDFCSPWIHPKSRTVEIDMKIPIDTPDGDYSLFYEDHKRKVDLHNHFVVER